MYSNANTSSLIRFCFFFNSSFPPSVTRSLLGFFNYNFTVLFVNKNCQFFLLCSHIFLLFSFVFICSFPGHCTNGMKIAINAL